MKFLTVILFNVFIADLCFAGLDVEPIELFKDQIHAEKRLYGISYYPEGSHWPAHTMEGVDLFSYALRFEPQKCYEFSLFNAICRDSNRERLGEFCQDPWKSDKRLRFEVIKANLFDGEKVKVGKGGGNSRYECRILKNDVPCELKLSHGFVDMKEMNVGGVFRFLETGDESLKEKYDMIESFWPKMPFEDFKKYYEGTKHGVMVATGSIRIKTPKDNKSIEIFNPYVLVKEISCEEKK